MSKEAKHKNFRRLAEKRMTRVFSSMNLVANLSNKNNYMYCIQEVEELFQAYETKGIEIKKFFLVDENEEEIKTGTISKVPEKKSLDANFSFSNENNFLEAKNIKFRSIAEKRINRVFSDMNLIANLSIKNNYTYTPQEITELFDAYQEKGKEIKKYFEPLKEEFTFSN